MTTSESPTHPDAPRAGGETPTAAEALAERATYMIECLRAVSESVNAGHDRYISNDADDAADLIAELRASLLARHRDGERDTPAASPEPEQAFCQLCGEPMPEGEEMFQYHGHSGPCPHPARSGG